LQLLGPNASLRAARNSWSLPERLLTLPQEEKSACDGPRAGPCGNRCLPWRARRRRAAVKRL